MLGDHAKPAGTVIKMSHSLESDRSGACHCAADTGGRRASGRSAAVPMPARPTLATDLQKYKRDRNRTLPGIACKTGS